MNRLILWHPLLSFALLWREFLTLPYMPTGLDKDFCDYGEMDSTASEAIYRSSFCNSKEHKYFVRARDCKRTSRHALVLVRIVILVHVVQFLDRGPMEKNIFPRLLLTNYLGHCTTAGNKTFAYSRSLLWIMYFESKIGLYGDAIIIDTKCCYNKHCESGWDGFKRATI